MTKYHYCLLLMGSLLLGSCQSVEQLSIDYMLPAEVSFPATLKRVAVVNNMPNVPDNKLIITEEEQKKSENEVARLTNYYNGDAAITTESLAEALANENYFEEVVICDSEFGRRFPDSPGKHTNAFQSQDKLYARLGCVPRHSGCKGISYRQNIFT